MAGGMGVSTPTVSAETVASALRAWAIARAMRAMLLLLLGTTLMVGAISTLWPGLRGGSGGVPAGVAAADGVDAGGTVASGGSVPRAELPPGDLAGDALVDWLIDRNERSLAAYVGLRYRVAERSTSRDLSGRPGPELLVEADAIVHGRLYRVTTLRVESPPGTRVPSAAERGGRGVGVVAVGGPTVGETTVWGERFAARLDLSRGTPGEIEVVDADSSGGVLMADLAGLTPVFPLSQYVASSGPGGESLRWNRSRLKVLGLKYHALATSDPKTGERLFELVVRRADEAPPADPKPGTGGHGASWVLDPRRGYLVISGSILSRSAGSRPETMTSLRVEYGESPVRVAGGVWAWVPRRIEWVEQEQTVGSGRFRPGSVRRVVEVSGVRADGAIGGQDFELSAIAPAKGMTMLRRETGERRTDSRRSVFDGRRWSER